MAEVDQAKLHLVEGDGTFNLQGMEEFARKTHIFDKGLSYAVVAIMGPQSSGKSTLLNALFNTKFEMMDFLKGRGQTTKGIWMASANAGLQTYTLVLDLEGTDGRERGEDDTAFEKQSTLFALATADVIIVNMWCHDIGREHASNKPLLKTVFQVMLRLFQQRKATLLFVIRDKTRTPIESLEPILREDLEKIWASVPKPEKHRDSNLSDFFNVEVTWLPNFEEKEEEFNQRVLMLRERFQRSVEAGEIAGDRTGAVPAQGLALHMQSIWDLIKHNRDLDLPAHKIMVATVRCEQIAEEKIQTLLTSQEWGDAQEWSKRETDLPKFGPLVNDLVNQCLLSYDGEAAYFEEKVKSTKREQLIGRLKEAISPSHSAAVSLALDSALSRFKASLVEATGGEEGSAAQFAQSVRECKAQALSDVERALSGMDVSALSLEVGTARAKFDQDLNSFTQELRTKKLKTLQEDALEFLKSALSDKVGSILEAGKPDAWARIRVLWTAEMKLCRGEVEAALEGFEMGEEEREKVIKRVEGEGEKAIEEKTGEMAKQALQIMKEKFTSVFMHDKKGMPRRFNSNTDISKLAHDARHAALVVLASLAAVQLAPPLSDSGSRSLREGQSGLNTDPPNPVLVRLLPLLEEEGEESAVESVESQGETGGGVPSERPVKRVLSRQESKSSTARLWDALPVSAVFLTPEDCKRLFKELKKDTLFQVAQAQQAQEASKSNSWLPPPWALFAMFILGFNEIMTLLRNPLLGILLAALGFFGYSVYREVGGGDPFQHGIVPGVISISTKLVPAVLALIHQWMAMAVQIMDTLKGPQHQTEAHTGLSVKSNSTASSYTNGVEGNYDKAEVSTSQGGRVGQELRHRVVPSASNASSES